MVAVFIFNPSLLFSIRAADNFSCRVHLGQCCAAARQAGASERRGGILSHFFPPIFAMASLNDSRSNFSMSCKAFHSA
jgi:hypothetical protein